ncbi:MAG: uridine kinase [Tissierellia bacterium]|nr:uridine kinase [Tissierellia bacterium]MDD4725607.1 uridine kinase [Tissierellia bacterium]
MKKPLLIGIAGGTGSGKTTVTKEIIKSISSDDVVVIEQDSYYKDQSTLSFEERVNTNYDHPDAFDNELMIKQLKDLLDGKTINKPIYDFENHNRKVETETVEPKNIIILEGILILFDEKVRNLLDIKIYVDTDSDVRIIRRILRDIKERGRTLDSIIVQYMGTVRPAHLQFIEPTKRYSDIIIPEGGYNKVAVDIIVAKINEIIKK